MLRAATNKTYLFGLLKVRETCIWISLLLVAPSFPSVFVCHLHSPGWGCLTRGVTSIKPAKGRVVSPCTAGQVLWWLIENGVSFEKHSHVQTPLTNQLSKGFCSFEAQKLLPLTPHSPGWRDKGYQCCQVHLKLENFKCSQWPDYLSFHLTTVQSVALNYGKRKKRCIIINKWMELFAIYYLSPQYWQALVIHEI